MEALVSQSLDILENGVQLCWLLLLLLATLGWTPFFNIWRLW
jgi:hypothetical protein